MSGPWMTSTSDSSVLTCATDMAGVTMDTAGQHSQFILLRFFLFHYCST